MSIDLGSKWVKVAVDNLKPGQPPISIAINEMSKRKSPALVASHSGDRLIGEEAAGLAAMDLTQIHLATVLGPDPTHFETLIAHLMSTSNDRRSHAESIFNLAKQSSPDALSLKLLHLLASSPHLEAHAMATVLLRRLCGLL